MEPFDSDSPQHEDPVEPTPVAGKVLPPYLPEHDMDYPERSFETAPPSDPIEPLNPWIGIITQPHATIRYILESGVWNNIWALYAIVFVMMIPTMILSMFMQPPGQNLPPEMDQTATTVMMGGMLVGMLVVGYPIGMLVIYLFSYLYKVAGGWLGGVGTTPELRIAFTWSYVASMYMNILLIVPYALIAYHNYNAGPMEPPEQIMMSLAPMLFSLPVLIICLVIASKCIGEAHRFSAWKGLGTILLAGCLWMAIWIGLMLVIGLSIFAIATVVSLL